MSSSALAASRSRLRALSLENWLLTALIATGALNLIVFFAQLRGMLTALYRNPDTSVAPVLAALSSGQGPAREVILGDHPYYEAWWLETATRGLPGHWQIWQAIPIVIAFLGIALLAWAAWRVLGLFGAVVTTTVMLSLGDAMRWIMFTSDAHGYSAAHAALLVAAGVFVAERAVRGDLPWSLLAAVGVPLAALSAAGGTDQLFEVVFLPSFALAGCLVWWRHSGRSPFRLAIFCVAVAAVAIVGAELLDALMISLKVKAAYYPITFVEAGNVLSNLQLTITSLAYLAGGAFFGQPLHRSQLLVFAVGLLALLAVLVVLRFIWREGRALGTRQSRLPVTRDLYVAFWSLVIVLSLAAYLFTNLPRAEGDARYLVGVFVGSAALLPVLTGERTAARVALVAAVSAFGVLVAVNHMVAGPPNPAERTSPTSAEAHKMLRYARSQGANHGYAGYYVGPVATWETEGALRAYPVVECHAAYLCPYFLGDINTWYEPRSGARSFLIADSNDEVSGNVSGGVANFGEPVAKAEFGTYSVLVYDHDIAEDLVH